MDLFHNQTFLAALMLMVSGAVMALARRVPQRLWEWTRRRMILTVTVHNHDRMYHWTKVWLDAQPFMKSCRSLEASTNQELCDPSVPQTPVPTGARSLPKILFTPANGIHVFFYRGRLMILDRNGNQSPSSSGDAKDWKIPTETMTITVIGRDPETVRRLMQEAMEFAQPPEDPRITITVSVYGYWRQSQRLQPRSLDSVILPPGAMQSLLDDVKTFLAREEFYRQVGIPYRRGWLLKGVPGSGKSSSIIALAGHLKLNIYVLNIASKGMSDERLTDLLVDVPSHSIVLLEDIDATFDGRDKTQQGDQSGVTFSGLLNALDGVASKDGRLLFMTTNHPERLDPALTRPGRVDMQMDFGYATGDQLGRLFERFNPGRSSWEFAARYRDTTITMAEAQELLLAGGPRIHEAASAD